MNVNNSVSLALPAIALDADGRLALMVLERQQAQEHGARADEALARERFLEASSAEVEAMRDEADHVLAGAIVQGAFTLAASGVQVRDAMTPGQDAMEEAKAAVLSSAAPILGKVFGDAPAARDQADAKHAAANVEQARWQMEDADELVDQANQTRDKAIDWLSTVNANQASAETGIIAGLA